jgi:chromosome segregation ATPase
MATRANVTSIEAIDAFRSSLIVFLTKARPTLEEVSSDVQRLRSWLENEQRNHWENELRKREKALENALQALFSAQIAKLRRESTAEQVAVHRAKRAVEEAREKLRILKNWTREFDSRVEPLVKQMEKLQTFLAHDMGMAVAYLAQTINTLDAYAGVAPVAVSSSSASETEKAK